MALAHNTVASGLATDSDTLDVTSVDCTGSNTYLLVLVGWNDDSFQSVTSVTIDPGGGDETALAAIAGTEINIEDDGSVQAWGVVAPPSGTFTVRVILDDTMTLTGQDMMAYCICLTGCDQTTPIDNANTANGTSDTPAVTITTATGDIAFAIAWQERRTTNFTVGGSQTSLAHQVSNDGSNASKGTDASSIAFSWTGDDDKWVACGVNANAASGGGGGQTTPILSYSIRNLYA